MTHKKAKVFLVEDEPNNLAYLQDLLEDHLDQVELVGYARNLQQALERLPKLQPDLLFLDIHLPDGDGFDLIHQLPAQTKIIFTTAYPEYALEAFRYAALHYLVKPIDPNDLAEALKRFRDAFQPETVAEQPLIIPTQERMLVISPPKILYLIADGSYTDLHLEDQVKYTASKPLNHHERLLHPQFFHRIHDKYLVNLRQIRAYHKGNGGMVEMNNGQLLDVSVRKKNNFLKYLDPHLLR
jgi:two-component system LytT family response regulator